MDSAGVFESDGLTNGLNQLRELFQDAQDLDNLFKSICNNSELSFVFKLDQVQYISRYLPDEELQPRVQSLCYNLQSELKNIPTFIHLAGDPKKIEIDDIWRSDLEWDQKLARLDEIARNAPTEYQYRYFRWRFIQKRDLVFEVRGLIEGEEDGLKKIVKLLYQSESTLDEFGKALYKIRSLFSDQGRIINFLVGMQIRV